MATGRVPTTANSPLTAKGDLFGYSTAPARLAVGNDGEQIVADSSATTGLRYQSGYNGNAVINGGMDIWQRGTSFTGVAGTYTADRWLGARPSNVAGLDISRQVTGDTTNLPQIQYCLRAQRTSGNSSTNNYYIGYSLETADSLRFAGQAITLSFYARAGANYSPTSSALIANIYTGTGTDQNINVGYTGSANPSSVTHTLTTTWQRFQQTVTLSASATELALLIIAVPTGTASTNDYFEITGVQIELGSRATTFKRSSGGTIQGELAACQRYYARFGSNGGGYNTFAIGAANTVSNVGAYVKLPVTMRVTPTSIDYSTLGAYDGVNIIGSSGSTVALISNESGRDNAKIDFTKSSAFTQFRPYFIFTDGSSTGFLGFSAEL